jgi:hypothetical protein
MGIGESNPRRRTCRQQVDCMEEKGDSREQRAFQQKAMAAAAKCPEGRPRHMLHVRRIRRNLVGGIGIAPGANINYVTGHAIFEATHGTAPKYANQDKVNPGSVILSGEMMLRYLGWNEAADLIISSLGKTIAQKRVTYDFERMMAGATLVSCSGFAKAMTENM